MKISFSPQLSNAPLELVRISDDALSINGNVFDFSILSDGDEVSHRDVPGMFFTDAPVRRVNGQIEMTLILPHSDTAPHERRHAEPIVVTENGPVTLPANGVEQ